MGLLSEKLGLEELCDETIDIAPFPGRRAATLVHALVTGATCIDDADVLRAGATSSVLSHRVMAPSTLGTFLRAFSFGHYADLRIMPSWCNFDCVCELWRILHNAHHLRELRAVSESGQRWADELSVLLVTTHAKVHAGKAAGLCSLSTRTLSLIIHHYDELVQAGPLANPPPLRTAQPGRPSRTKAANLRRAPESLPRRRTALCNGLLGAFSNNQAERDLRMVKLQQKISECYRTEVGATNYLAIRSYVSSAREQGINVLGALRDLFEGHPFMPGITPG